ncbi:uncharacterized protein [Musca autumnalis]|uniref:uncharacterized protein n=1 Tax=Musca autumnalis TaxID=221902 RepID=UPI003CF3AD00
MRLTCELIFLLAFYVSIDVVAVRFTNIKCQTFHPEFATFEKCNLKVIGRGIIGLNVYVKMWHLPVDNISVNMALFKRTNVYRPFLYNVTVDFCRNFANQKKHPLMDFFMKSVLKDSNINHTCPYNHDIIVKDLVLNANKFQYVPLPRGEYRYDVKVGAYNDWKADVKIFMDFNDV